VDIILVKTSILRQQSGPFWLENHQRLSQSLLGLGWINSFTACIYKRKGDSKHFIVVASCQSFLSFGYFLSLTDFVITFIRLIDRVLSLYALVTNRFTSADFLYPWRA
jgi:hypothetical protein